MPHRIARSLRVLLLLAGVLLLALLPISFFVAGYLQVDYKNIIARNGYVLVTEILQKEVELSSFPLLEAADATAQESLTITPPPKPEPIFPVVRSAFYGYTGIDLQKIRPWDALLPSFKRVPYTFELVLPLWIPAVACLAWPMTSFLARRRRRKRGFPVDLIGG